MGQQKNAAGVIEAADIQLYRGMKVPVAWIAPDNPIPRFPAEADKDLRTDGLD